MRFSLIWPCVFALASASPLEVTPIATGPPTAVQIQERAVKPTTKHWIGVSPWKYDPPQRPVISDYIATDGKWKGTKSDEMVLTMTKTDDGKTQTETVTAPIALITGKEAGKKTLNVVWSPKLVEKLKKIADGVPSCPLKKRANSACGPRGFWRALQEARSDDEVIRAFLENINVEGAANLLERLGLTEEGIVNLGITAAGAYGTAGFVIWVYESFFGGNENTEVPNTFTIENEKVGGGENDDKNDNDNDAPADEATCAHGAPTGKNAPPCKDCGGTANAKICTKGKWVHCPCAQHAVVITVQQPGGWDIRLPESDLFTGPGLALASVWASAAAGKGQLADSQKPKVNCSNHYGDATSIEKDFLEKLAKKFCKDGKDEAVLDHSAINGNQHNNTRVAFKVNRGKNCQATCEQGFQSLINECEGIDSHTAQPMGNASVPECKATYHYEIVTTPVPECNVDRLSKVPNNLFRHGPVWKDFCEHEDNSDDSRTMSVDVNGNKPTILKRDLEDSNATLLERGLEPRTPPPNPDSEEYKNLKFILSWEPNHMGTRTLNCSEAFYTISQTKCGNAGGTQNLMAKEASVWAGDGTYRYVIHQPYETRLKPQNKGAWFEDQFPDPKKFTVGDAIKPEHKDPTWKACGASWRDDIFMTPKKHERGGDKGYGMNDLWFTAFWKKNCKLENHEQKQYMNNPLGDKSVDCRRAFRFAASGSLKLDTLNNLVDHPYKALEDTFTHDPQETYGGWMDFGCLRYMVIPTTKNPWKYVTQSNITQPTISDEYDNLPSSD